jgi:predicted DNA-binding transcriptional regulator AlpA
MPLHSTGLSREERGAGVGTAGVGVGDLNSLDRVRSLKETAALLGVSMSTLRRRIDDGSLKTVRLSVRRVGVTDRAREAFLRDNAA